jgi:hypothetical protein
MASVTAAFDALFPAPSISAPTPQATPSIGFPGDDLSFGAPTESWTPGFGPGSIQARRLLALSSARNFLSIVSAAPELMTAAGIQEMHVRLKARESNELFEAVKLLLEDWPDVPFHDEDLVRRPRFYANDYVLTLSS